MRHVLARLALLPILGGCSLIYNESNIPTVPPDAGPDAEIDAEIIVDADPSMMMLTGVSPPVITEGQGVGGSRAAVIVIDGQHLVKANLMVMVTAAATATKTPMLMVDMAAVDVDANGRRLAVPISLPVDARGGAIGITAGDSIPLDITVIQTVPGGPTITRMLTGMLTLKGLAELTTIPGGGFPASSEYSQITLSGGMIRGAAGVIVPIVIRATSSITLTGVDTSVSASGMNAGPGGGRGGMGGAGGLTGGNSGQPGMGPAPGAPSGGIGRYTGDEQLISLLDPNRGSGGAGGDGAGVLNGSAGGNGGGGGGSIEITAGGDANLGNINATGAAGTTTNASSGGGGSGGVVLVRAGGALTAGTILVTSLGTGQPGRGRYDGATAIVGNPMAVFRGPMFMTVPLITNLQKPMITVAGQPQKNFHYFFSSANGVDESSLFDDGFPPSGTKTFALAGPLFPGLNKLCLVVDGGDKTSATRNCIDIALLYKP